MGKFIVFTLFFGLSSILVGQKDSIVSVVLDTVVTITKDTTKPTIIIEDSSSLLTEIILEETGFVVDFAPEYPDSVIEARIAATFSDVPLRYNDRIKSFIDYFTIRNRDYTRKMIRRADAYFPIMEEVLAKNNMPESIKYLAIVESGLDPKIRSWAGAMGLWQFMPATGKAYKLDYDYYIDERLDPYKATDAACKYLKVLYNMFGDWELALGAYNCGPGNMRKAIRRSGYKKTFEEVYNYLPRETRSYVPQFMAVNYVMRHTEEHNLYVEDWEKEYLPSSDTIICNQYLDVNKLAEVSGVCSEYIIQLNPEIKRNTITKEWKDYKLALPREFSLFSTDSLMAMLLSSSEKGEEGLNYAYKNPNAGDLAGSTKIRYQVRSGDNLGLIAQRHGVSIRDVKGWNNLRSSTIYPGQRLTIYIKGVHKDGPTLKTSPVTTTPVVKVIVKDGEQINHIVQKGEFLGSIASKYDVSVSQIRSWNGVSGNLIHVGQKLVIYNKNKLVTPLVEVDSKIDAAKPTEVYVVKSGDALYNIAVLNNMTVDELKSLNGLSDNKISVGQKIKVYKGSTVNRVLDSKTSPMLIARRCDTLTCG